MAKRKIETWTREQYAAALQAGRKFRDAYFYEDQHAPRDAFFVYVQLGPHEVRYKREIKP